MVFYETRCAKFFYQHSLEKLNYVAGRSLFSCDTGWLLGVSDDRKTVS